MAIRPYLGGWLDESSPASGHRLPLNLRLVEEIGQETYVAKKAELRDRVDKLKLQIEVCDRGKDENANIAVKAFELSQ